MKIGIVTDSTADLPANLIAEYNIEVIPLQVSIDNQSYLDGVELSADEFYQKLQHTKTHPITSQPALGVFMDCYQNLLKKFDAILSIHLTEKLSGTVHTAQMAKEMIQGAKIAVIDSYSTTMGLGGLVLEAARRSRAGINFEQLVSSINQLREQVKFFVTLDTLEFLRRGGRAGTLQAFLSSVLQIKPLLQLVQGRIELVGKVRRRGEAIQMMLNEFKLQLSEDSKYIIAIMHTAAENEALKLKSIIQEQFKNAEIILNQAGPVLGTHVGPGALALIGLPVA